MKKQTRKQKYSDYSDAVKAINEGKPVKRAHAKDGSIATHSVVPVEDKPEKDVLSDCLIWLAEHNIFCNRMNVGAGRLADGITWATYGVKGSGDIIGLLRTGQHLEVECKRGKGGRLSLSQQKRMKEIRESNGIYFVVHGVAELEYYFKDLI